MKTILVIILIFSFNLFSQTKDTTQTYNVDYLSLFKDSLKVIQLQNQLNILKLNAKLDSVQNAVKEISNFKSKLITLEKQVNSINIKDQLINEGQKDLIASRYKLGENILNQMIEGTGYIQNLNDLLIVQPEQDTASTSDILSRLHLQNFWDKVNNYTPIFGLVISGASAIFIHDPRTASIIGLSSVIVPGLFKLAFGHVNVSDFISALGYIGPTKKLYDEFNQRTFQIRELIAQNNSLRDTLISFENKYDNIPDVDSVKNLYYLKLQDKISEYQSMDRQILLTINQISDYFNKYKDSPGFSYVYNKFENYSNDFLNEYIQKYSQSFRSLNEKNKEMLFKSTLTLM